MSKMVQIRNVPDALHRKLRAEALGAPLLTCDRPLAGTAGHRATIEVVG